MCSDHNIHQSLFQAFDRLFLLRSRPETRHHFDRDRKIFHTLHKIIVMLLGKDRRRNKKYNLLPFLYCLKRRADRHLCFAIADIPADQAIHDTAALHIRLCRIDRQKLILRFLIRKHFFKLALPYSVFSVLIAFSVFSCRIQLYQILGNLIDCALYLGLRFCPFLCTQLIQLWCFAFCGSIFHDRIKARCQHIKSSTVAVFDLHIVLHDLVYAYLFDTTINAQAMRFMYDIIAYLQFREVMNLLSFIVLLFPFLCMLAENIAFRDHRKTDRWIFKTLADLPMHDHDLPILEHTLRIFAVKSSQLIGTDILCQSFCSCPRRRQQDHAIPVFMVTPQVFQQDFKTVLERIDRSGICIIPLLHL